MALWNAEFSFDAEQLGLDITATILVDSIYEYLDDFRGKREWRNDVQSVDVTATDGDGNAVALTAEQEAACVQLAEEEFFSRLPIGDFAVSD